MPTPEEQLQINRRGLLAVVCGAAAGTIGGLLIPGGMGFLGPQPVQGGIFCFGLPGLLAGPLAAWLCVCCGSKDETLRSFEAMILSLFVGLIAGLLASLPLALMLREYVRGLNGLGHS